MDYTDQTPLHELSTEQLQHKLKKTNNYNKLLSAIDISWGRSSYYLTQAMGLSMLDPHYSRREHLKILSAFAQWQQTFLNLATLAQPIRELREHYANQAKQINEVIKQKTT